MTCQKNKSQFKIRQHIFLACGLRCKIMVFFKSFFKRTEELKDTLKDFHEQRTDEIIKIFRYIKGSIFSKYSQYSKHRPVPDECTEGLAWLSLKVLSFINVYGFKQRKVVFFQWKIGFNLAHLNKHKNLFLLVKQKNCRSTNFL